MSSAEEVTGGANKKLPLWGTIGRAYSRYFDHFLDVLRISWLWLVVAPPLSGLTTWLQLSRMAEVFANVRTETRLQMPVVAMPIGMTVLVYGAGLFWILAGVSIAVAWHRRIILDEQPRPSGGNIVTVSLWRYVGIGIVIFLIAALPVAIVVLLMLFFFFPVASSGGPSHPPVAFSLIPMLTLLIATVVVLRLSLLFPARAVGDVETTLKGAWQRTRGNTWRLFWGLVACSWPPVLVFQILSLAALGLPRQIPPGEEFFARFAAVSAISATWYLLILPIGIGFLSFSYLHFFGRPPNRISARA